MHTTHVDQLMYWSLEYILQDTIKNSTDQTAQAKLTWAMWDFRNIIQDNCIAQTARSTASDISTEAAGVMATRITATLPYIIDDVLRSQWARTADMLTDLYTGRKFRNEG